MPIKKYISPDVFPLTIRDNFRKLMGQHYVINEDGSVSWNPDVKILPDPGVWPLGVRADDQIATFQPEDPGQSPTTLRIRRVPTSLGTLTSELGLGRDALSGLATLDIKITADYLNYSSINRFTNDLDFIFKNPEDGDGLFYDRTFQFNTPELVDYSSISEYNYLVEGYESQIKNSSERILPNHYNLSIIERSGDVAKFESATGLSLVVSTPGSFPAMEPYQDTIDHTLLMGSIGDPLDPLSIIRDQGLFSESYIESEFLESGLTLEDYLLADLDKTLDIKYSNYFSAWPSGYVDLTSENQTTLENKGKNIIFSGVTGTALIKDAFVNALPTQNKLPFYSSVKFLPESYGTLSTSLGAGLGTVEMKPIAAELHQNLLYSTFGSHIAGVYNSGYVDTGDPNAPEYSFSSRTFFDQSNSEEANLLVSPELHDYINYASSLIGPEAAGSFTWAIGYHGVSSLFGVETGPSPVTSFALDDKLFIDVDVGVPEFETDLALRLAEEYPTAPLPVQSIAINNFIFQTTQMTTATPLSSPASSVYGVGGTEGLINQVNESFKSRRGASINIGRLYKESFEDGLPAHNETVMYRIAKYVGTNTNVEPIQDIWIPSQIADKGGLSSNIEYIDSQVKYGQEYTYQVSALKYVFGLKYGYKRTKEPKVSVVETVLDDDGITIGYIVRWTGFANLFDDWELAIADVPGSPDPAWATYASLYDPSYNYTPGDSVESAPGFSTDNAYYLSIERLNEILEKSWDLKPSTGEAFVIGGPAGPGFGSFSGLLGDHSPTSGGVPSWRNLFGFTWSDDFKVTSDTSINDENAFLWSARLTGNPVSLPTQDPSTFSVMDWLKLWFGSFDNKVFRYRSPVAGDSPTILGAVQGFPPSHHVFLLPYSPSSTVLAPDWGGVATYAPFGTPVTGFESLTSHSPDNILDVTGDPKIVYYDSSIEKVEPGSGATTVELTGYEAEYQIKMRPVAEIVEVPYFTTTTSVLSKPPPPPEISITPYRGVNDTLLLSLSSTNIEVEQYPTPIEEGEDKLFEMHLNAQNSLDGRITFSQDDSTAFFQIYRMDTPPNSYADFAGKLRNTLTTLLSSKEKIVRATSIGHDEALLPNVKYYYTFRSVDYHGNYSNPTPVYEVELVDDSGAVYLLVKMHEFPLITNDVPSIDMKKFIEVIPALSQVTADIPINTSVPDPSDLTTVELGNIDDAEHRIWDKTFKIRLTSKKTGKKLDFNVTFNKEDKRIKTT
jgi:hypothetical protein